jgi:hypothetical protein
MDIQSFEIAAPAAPTLNQLLTLLDTTAWNNQTGGNKGAMKVIPVMGISRITVAFLSVNQASQALGLVAFGSSDGVNFDQIQAGSTVNITASAAQVFDYVVDPYNEFKITYQAGTAPTVWRVTIHAIVGQRTVAT